MWDERFSVAEYIYGKEPNAFLQEQSSLFRPGSVILSLGEGEGRNAVFLAQLGCQVTAVDQSSVGLQKANALALERGVELSTIVQNLDALDMGDQKWDAVICIFCHLPPALRTVVHHNISQALRPGGIFLLEMFHQDQVKYNSGGPSDPSLLYSLQIMDQDFPDFVRLIAQEKIRSVNEGILHRGQGAVVQWVAQKPLTG